MKFQDGTIELGELLDREKIRDCLARYSRAIDRADGELLASVYWPEAVDDHGMFLGKAGDFVEWVIPMLRNMEMTQHFLGQTLIKVMGDEAAVETYFNAYHRLVLDGSKQEVLLGGRYVDRMARRGGEWKVADRKVLYDWYNDWASPAGGWTAFPMGAMNPNNQGVGGGGADGAAAFWARMK